MSEPKKYPWTARLAKTKPEAREAAKAAGRKMVEGGNEYDAYANLRSSLWRIRLERRNRQAAAKPTRTQEYLALTDARELVARYTLEMDFRGEIRCGRFLRPAMGRTLEKLGIPVRKVLRGFEGGKYGWKPVFSLLVLMDEYRDFVAYRAATAGRREKEKARRVVRRQEELAARERLADELGVLPDSRAFAWYMSGEIDDDECRRIGEITRHRHEATNYDELLAAGYSKEDARAWMVETE